MSSFSITALATALLLALPGMLTAQSPGTAVTTATGNINPTPDPCCECITMTVAGLKPLPQPGQPPRYPNSNVQGGYEAVVNLVINTGTGQNCPTSYTVTVRASARTDAAVTHTETKTATVPGSVTFQLPADKAREGSIWEFTLICGPGGHCPKIEIPLSGCHSCAGEGCGITAKPSATSSSFNASIPTTNSFGGMTKGSLEFYAENFANPGRAGLTANVPSNFTVTRDTNGLITSINTIAGTIQVTPSDAALLALDPNAFTVTHKDSNGTVFRVTTISFVTEGGIQRFRMDSTFEGTTSRYEQTQPTPGTLVMHEGKIISGTFEPLQRKTLVRTEPFLGTRILRETTSERASTTATTWTTVSDTESTWEKQIHGWVKTKQTLDPTGAAHTTTWTYYQPGETTGPGAATQGLGRLKRMIRHDGYEAYYTYGLNQTTIASTYGTNPIGKVTTTTWDPGTRTETTTTEINGQIVSKSSVAHTDTTTTSTQYTSNTGSLVTTTTHIPSGQDFGGKPVKTLHPDGTLTTYQYTRHPDGGYTTTTERGATTNNTTVAQGTRSTTKVNAQGKTIESSTQDIASGVMLSQSIATTIDSLGRPTMVVHDNDPADYETFTYSCCGLQSHRARDGTVTSYIKDGIDRTLAETTTTGARVITRTYDYTPSNGLPSTKVTTTATGVTGSVVQITVRDVLGRTVSSTSPGPMGTPETTEYAYSANGLITTQINPDDGEIVTESYPDGRTKSVSGTATIARTFTYDKHNENGGGEKTTVTTAGGVGGQSSSYSDLAGRTFKTERTAPHGQLAVTTTMYNALGQAETITSSGQPAVRYLYNPEGEQIATWTDRNGDGQFNDDFPPGVPEFKDSCTTTQSDYLSGASAPAGLGDCQRVITTVRTPDNEDKIVSITWQSVDGLRGRQENVGVDNPAQSTRSYPLEENRSNTVVTPDGTMTVTATGVQPDGYGQTTTDFYSAPPSVNVIESSSRKFDAFGRTVGRTNGRGHVTLYSYHGAGGQLASITQKNARPGGGDLVKSFNYSLTPGSGRRITTTLSDGSVQYEEVNLRGQIIRQWGSQTNPVKLTYDSAGNRSTLTTYRADVENVETFPEEPTMQGDKTEWKYDAAGVVTEKIHADGNKTTYTYDIAGRVLTRTWARGVVTTFHEKGFQLKSKIYFR